MNTLLCFFAYSFLGWLCECIYCSIAAKHFINRGFLEGPYCPIYGCGAILVVSLLLPFHDYPIIVFLIGMLLTSALEYMTGWLMEQLFHTRWWDYSRQFCNLHGRICLKNSLLFAMMVMVVCYGVHPLLLRGIRQLPFLVQMSSCMLLTVLFVIDLFNTLHALLRKNADFREIEACIKQLRVQFRSAHIFPLNEPLSTTIQSVLDSTDADERLLAVIQQLKQRIEVLHERHTHTWKRLKKAFPNHRERYRELLDKLNAIFKEHRR